MIAVGEGDGDLLSVSLDIVGKCSVSKVVTSLAASTINLAVQTSGT